MAKAYPYLRVANDPEGLSKEIERYRALLGCNPDPAAAQILKGLITEAEARLTGLRPR